MSTWRRGLCERSTFTNSFAHGCVTCTRTIPSSTNSNVPSTAMDHQWLLARITTSSTSITEISSPISALRRPRILRRRRQPRNPFSVVPNAMRSQWTKWTLTRSACMLRGTLSKIASAWRRLTLSASTRAPTLSELVNARTTCVSFVPRACCTSFWPLTGSRCEVEGERQWVGESSCEHFQRPGGSRLGVAVRNVLTMVASLVARTLRMYMMVG
mmetsp:Transcript_7554/g.17291  ORF Transcript_7554/g.17291 Transcript_7554/m.17291 type:complete len:214 (+) Transcript_7554:1074-1715(+)